MGDSEQRACDRVLSADGAARLSTSFAALEKSIAELQRRLKRQGGALSEMRRSLERARIRQTNARGVFVLPLLTIDVNGYINAADAASARLFGVPRGKLLGRRFSSLLLPDQRERWVTLFASALAAEALTTGELALQRGDGAIIDVCYACLRVGVCDGLPSLRVALANIAECKLIERELARLRAGFDGPGVTAPAEWLHGVVDQSLAGIYLIQDGRFTYANQGAADIFGYASPAEFISEGQVGKHVAPEDRALVARNIRRRAEGDVTEMRYTFTGMRKDGRRIDVEVHGRRILVDGKPAVIGVILDITERKLAEQQLRIAATAFESREGMFVTDADGLILRVNEAFSEITGYLSEEAVGRTPGLLDLSGGEMGLPEAMWAGADSVGAWHGEGMSRRKGGERIPVYLTLTAVRNAEGATSNYVGTLTNISARKSAEAKIEYLAFYDQLTRLPNRRLLIDRLHQALAVRARSGAGGALLFIDLDNFKDINDTLGHAQGDLLLQQVADRLSRCVREGDTIARLGGDEFVMMVEGLSASPAEAAAQSRQIGEKLLDELNRPYPIANQELHSTPSIGVTLFSDQHHSADELLRRADLAMYKAKDAGRNTLCFFDPELQAAVTARTLLESDLRFGLRDAQFLLYYQPQVGRTGRLTGAEALIRWPHPSRGLVSPSEFIPVAEASGMIMPLGHWVLQTACTQLVRWTRRPATSSLSIAVNVSARQFHHRDFVNQVRRVLDETGADPFRLKIELTESLLLKDVEDVIVKMGELKALGVQFSLDDFGTGFSSLAYLKRLPLDQIKIDQSFVSDVVTNDKDAAITRTIVDLARNLGLSVIAEGVESEAQRDLLASQGCLAYQGFLYGRPQHVDRFESLLRRPHRRLLGTAD